MPKLFLISVTIANKRNSFFKNMWKRFLIEKKLSFEIKPFKH